MNPLQTDHPLALSVLLNEEIYIFPETKISLIDEKAIEVLTEESITQNIINEEPKNVLKSRPAFAYLGDNNKYILIIVKEPVKEFVNREELAFLLKILAAKKWELKDIAIINTEKYSSLDFDDLKDYFACSKILTFGINPVSLKIIGASANKTLDFKGVKILGTWTLAQLEKDTSKKTVYWNELKNF